MPILLESPHADRDRQPTHRPTVARPVQPVEHTVRARRAEQLLHARILWHGLDDAPTAARPSFKNGSETLGEGVR